MSSAFRAGYMDEFRRDLKLSSFSSGKKIPGKKCGGSYISAGYNCRKERTGPGSDSAAELADRARAAKGLKPLPKPESSWKPKPIEQQKQEREQRREQEFEALSQKIPDGARRAAYDEAYWEYAKSRGKERPGAHLTNTQRRDLEKLQEFVPVRRNFSVQDRKKLKQYNDRKKLVAQYKRGILPQVVAEFNRIHEKKDSFSDGYDAIMRADDIGQWFDENWVRISSEGRIMGPCGDRSTREGKPKCLPERRARSMSKSDLVSAVRRKRRKDPSKNRSGKARMVET
jgi:hypothetical protein